MLMHRTKGLGLFRAIQAILDFLFPAFDVVKLRRYQSYSRSKPKRLQVGRRYSLLSIMEAAGVAARLALVHRMSNEKGRRISPTTYRLGARYQTALSVFLQSGIRTHDLSLSCGPIMPVYLNLVWVVGFEPTTPRFQGEYSNRTELHPDAR